MLTDSKYADQPSVQDLLALPSILGGFHCPAVTEIIGPLRKKQSLYLTGSGRERYFPALNAVYTARRAGIELAIHTEDARQSFEYDLTNWLVLAACAHGDCPEVNTLFERLTIISHPDLYVVTAAEDKTGAALASAALHCPHGTDAGRLKFKTIIQTALIYQLVLAHFTAIPFEKYLPGLARAIETIFAQSLNTEMLALIPAADNIYVAGRNDGTALDLAALIRRLFRKNAHAVEPGAILAAGSSLDTAKSNASPDLLILINPYRSHIDFLEKTLNQSSLRVMALSDESLPLPGLKLPEVGMLANFMYLIAGWNLVLQAALESGIDTESTS